MNLLPVFALWASTCTSTFDVELASPRRTLIFLDGFDQSDSSGDEDEEDVPLSARIEIDLGLSAYGNAKAYYDSKKEATRKEMKTIDASKKALKSAEKKTMESLKDIEIVKQISKARKTLWFEKFIWFISSENYLVIAGRDAQVSFQVVRRLQRFR